MGETNQYVSEAVRRIAEALAKEIIARSQDFDVVDPPTPSPPSTSPSPLPRTSKNKSTPSSPTRSQRSDRTSKRSSSSTKAVKWKTRSEKGLSSESYEVEAIMAKRTRASGNEYLLRWAGYSSDEDTWESVDHINCNELIEDFEKRKAEERAAKKKAKERREIRRRESESIGGNTSAVEEARRSPQPPQNEPVSDDDELNVEDVDEEEERVRIDQLRAHLESDHGEDDSRPVTDSNISEDATISNHDVSSGRPLDRKRT